MDSNVEEVSLVKDNIMRMNSPSRVFNGYLYCKMKKEYRDIDSESGMMVMLRDFELEKIKTQKLGLILTLEGRGLEYMKVEHEDVEKHILKYYDTLYGVDEKYKLIGYKYLPNSSV